ncbi:Os09g0257466 [Oryza sativa Japonica Group]|uniref:Os09g0257466 protein n=1 Tax=Oryza sativa subsp. japonica TaxID=39947 RepID=A0A0P0XJK8_ORYSJ|nr:Os09g0257466 [Oryza sativa Japonica Group]
MVGKEKNSDEFFRSLCDQEDGRCGHYGHTGTRRMEMASDWERTIAGGQPDLAGLKSLRLLAAAGIAWAPAGRADIQQKCEND